MRKKKRMTGKMNRLAAVLLAAVALSGCKAADTGKETVTAEAAAVAAEETAAVKETKDTIETAVLPDAGEVSPVSDPVDPEKLEPLNGKVMAWMNTGFKMTPEQAYKDNGVMPSEILFFPTENEAIAALKSGRADMSMMPYEAGHFLTRRDPDLQLFRTSANPHQMFMLVRRADTELLEQLNTAIAKLKDEGTLDTLFQTLVVELDPENLVNAETIPKIPGAETVYVGVSGDMMPLDYIGPDGKPAGYNVALMTEISRLIGKNVVFVSIPTDAKLQGLLSKRIDAFFWHGFPSDSEEITVTDPYVTFSGFGAVTVKKK